MKIQSACPLCSGTPLLPLISPAAHSLLQLVHLPRKPNPSRTPKPAPMSRDEEGVPPTTLREVSILRMLSRDAHIVRCEARKERQDSLLQAFTAHPQMGNTPSPSSHPTSAQNSFNGMLIARKYGFIFLICASGKSTDGVSLFHDSHSNGYGCMQRRSSSMSSIDYSTQKASDDSKKILNKSPAPQDLLEFDKNSLVWGKPRQPPLDSDKSKSKRSTLSREVVPETCLAHLGF